MWLRTIRAFTLSFMFAWAGLVALLVSPSAGAIDTSSGRGISRNSICPLAIAKSLNLPAATKQKLVHLGYTPQYIEASSLEDYYQNLEPGQLGIVYQHPDRSSRVLTADLVFFSPFNDHLIVTYNLKNQWRVETEKTPSDLFASLPSCQALRSNWDHVALEAELRHRAIIAARGLDFNKVNFKPTRPKSLGLYILETETLLNAKNIQEAKTRIAALTESYSQILNDVRVFTTGHEFHQMIDKTREYLISKSTENYCRDFESLSQLLDNKNGCANCVANMLLYVALFYDLKVFDEGPWVLAVRDYYDHVAPALFDFSGNRVFQIDEGQMEVADDARLLRPEVILWTLLRQISQKSAAATQGLRYFFSVSYLERTLVLHRSKNWQLPFSISAGLTSMLSVLNGRIFRYNFGSALSTFKSSGITPQKTKRTFSPSNFAVDYGGSARTFGASAIAGAGSERSEIRPSELEALRHGFTDFVESDNAVLRSINRNITLKELISKLTEIADLQSDSDAEFMFYVASAEKSNQVSYEQTGGPISEVEYRWQYVTDTSFLKIRFVTIHFFENREAQHFNSLTQRARADYLGNYLLSLFAEISNSNRARFLLSALLDVDQMLDEQRSVAYKALMVDIAAWLNQIKLIVDIADNLPLRIRSKIRFVEDNFMWNRSLRNLPYFNETQEYLTRYRQVLRERYREILAWLQTIGQNERLHYFILLERLASSRLLNPSGLGIADELFVSMVLDRKYRYTLKPTDREQELMQKIEQELKESKEPKVNEVHKSGSSQSAEDLPVQQEHPRPNVQSQLMPQSLMSFEMVNLDSLPQSIRQQILERPLPKTPRQEVHLDADIFANIIKATKWSTCDHPAVTLAAMSIYGREAYWTYVRNLPSRARISISSAHVGLHEQFDTTGDEAATPRFVNQHPALREGYLVMQSIRDSRSNKYDINFLKKSDAIDIPAHAFELANDGCRKGSWTNITIGDMEVGFNRTGMGSRPKIFFRINDGLIAATVTETLWSEGIPTFATYVIKQVNCGSWSKSTDLNIPGRF